jgi:hypothetical protein
MENKKNRKSRDSVLIVKKRIILLTAALVVGLIAAGATVYGVLPSISLNSPTSFPVDI